MKCSGRCCTTSTGTLSGFGNAPKFPVPHNLRFLLRYAKRTGDAHALEMVEKTLREMRKGGIWDHVGFGFHRYSTDRVWLLPHFEKMLYDQGLLAMACLIAARFITPPVEADANVQMAGLLPAEVERILMESPLAADDETADEAWRLGLTTIVHEQSRGDCGNALQ